MHKAKQHIARAAERLRGMERKKFLAASAVIVAFALVVVFGTIWITNALQPAQVGGTDIVVSGEIACLPHKDASGPQTLECALGLHSDDNRYYALKNPPQSINTGTGKRVEVHGKLNGSTDGIYNIAGTIDVSSLIF